MASEQQWSFSNEVMGMKALMKSLQELRPSLKIHFLIQGTAFLVLLAAVMNQQKIPFFMGHMLEGSMGNLVLALYGLSILFNLSALFLKKMALVHSVLVIQFISLLDNIFNLRSWFLTLEYITKSMEWGGDVLNATEVTYFNAGLVGILGGVLIAYNVVFIKAINQKRIELFIEELIISKKVLKYQINKNKIQEQEQEVVFGQEKAL